MSKTSTLSLTMIDALEMADKHGGRLVRFVGGFWSWDGVTRDHNGWPTEYFGTTTIQALVARGQMAYSEYRSGRRYKFPVAATVLSSGDREAQPKIPSTTRPAGVSE